MTPGVFQFGDFHLDCSRFELLRKGRGVRLERKPMELLILLASRRGELVSREEITEHLWGREVFVDAERGINTAVRKVRYVLRDDPDRPRFIQTVTGRGYRFSGVIEEVSQNVSPSELGNGGAPEPKPAKNTTDDPALPEPKVLAHPAEPRCAAGTGFSRLAVTGTAIVVVAVILLVGVREISSHSANRAALTQIHSLAVLPLKNSSGDPAQDYFANGMTDELTTMLAKDSTLRIAPPSSVMHYKGTDKPTREIAQALQVDGIVVGSVNQSGGKVYIKLQLVNETTEGPNDKAVWSESFVRDVNQAVLLPAEAAMAIAKLTNSAAAGPTPERYVSPEAHEAYLHGRYLWVSEHDNNEAGKYFLKAAALQPDYALAWSGVADYYGEGLVTGVMDPREMREPFEAAAEKGVELDGTSAQTRVTLCAALFLSRWDMTAADRECRRAIDLDPEFAEAYHLRAKLLIAMNRDQEAIASQKTAMALDPFARPWALAYIYLLARQYDAAIIEANQRLESSPHNSTILLVLSAAYRCKGMYAASVKAREESLISRDDKADAEAIQREFERGGRLGVVHSDLDSLQRAARGRYVSPMDMAIDYAQLGDREKTLSLLEEAYRQRSPMLLTQLQSDPAYDFLHTSTRYRALIQKIGLPLEH